MASTSGPSPVHDVHVSHGSHYIVSHYTSRTMQALHWYISAMLHTAATPSVYSVYSATWHASVNHNYASRQPPAASRQSAVEASSDWSQYTAVPCE